MSQGASWDPGHVVIVGGGVAGLEALLALSALAGDRVTLTLVSRDSEFVDRPVTVAAPFGLRSPAHYPLAEIAEELGADFVQATVAGVDAPRHRVSRGDGQDLDFDTLILAPGAQLRPPFDSAITFGMPGSGQAIKEMLDGLRRGDAQSAEFVAPSQAGWLLPLYELALMTAREVARSEADGVRLRLVSPEDQPLALFGENASNTVARLLDAAGIEFIGGTAARVGRGQMTLGASQASVGVEYVVTLPLMAGPTLEGVPTTQPHDFLPVDEYGRVEGLTDVYAAGDAVNFPVKQGGLAAQQADAVAEHVAARYGAPVEPAPFRPVLRGMLFTGGQPRFMRSDVPGADPDIPGSWYPLWWPPTKVAGRYLAPYLFRRDDEEGFVGHPEGFTDIDIPLTEYTLPG
jgi:sulfide:quinone oxidoreductase